MTEGPQRAVAVGTTAASVLLLLAAPTPARCLRMLGAAGSAADPAAPLLALLALLAWVLAGWLALTVLLTAGGHLPGPTGRPLTALARRVAPAAVRRSVEAALGLTVAVGVLASPAAAAPAPAAAAAGAAAVDRSAAPAADIAPDLDWPATGDPAVRPATPTPPAPAPAGAGLVVVKSGDTLWGLAERELRDRRAAEPAAAEPTDAEVAAAWPAWWSVNREAVGDDPHLIRPGTALAPPGADLPPAG